jgi:hypothetical protein
LSGKFWTEKLEAIRLGFEGNVEAFFREELIVIFRRKITVIEEK